MASKAYIANRLEPDDPMKDVPKVEFRSLAMASNPCGGLSLH